MDAAVQDLMLKVKSSDVREDILKYLYFSDERVRPSKILEALRPQMETSSGNFYMNLGKLHDLGLVDKIEGESRATLYWLTEDGQEVAEQLADEWNAQEAPEQPSDGTKTSAVSQAAASHTAETPDEEPVNPEFVNALARWLANRSEGPDEVIRAAQELKQG
jgi:Fe2+ or Zn2+ uptake regulation protein